ncbi:PPE family protein [Mycobacterium sp. pUA109]|uniref:PPE family protein n=1 Tax=Mycobacterium sp. pUA109 TaxID=3238982 RepID=UPI00351BC270
MFDFGVLPPEVNSARMYDGPGAGPLHAAASEWNSLSAELSSTAAGFRAELAELATHWQGRSSTDMEAAAARYVAWMTQTATQAQQTADQIAAAIAAYEAAFAATVPPPVIEANRALVISLSATNFLGQHTPAIAAVEAAYAEMWAQDAAAMYGYAASALTATRLTAFSPPPPISNPAERSGHDTALAQTAGHAQLMSAVTQQLQTLAGSTKSAAADAATGNASSGLLSAVKDFSTVTGPLTPVWQTAYATNQWVSLIYAMKADAEAGSAAAQPTLAPQLIAAKPAPSAAAGVRGPVLASMGRTMAVGGLSVPQGWASTTPMAGTVADSPSAGMGFRAVPAWAHDPSANDPGGSRMWGPGPLRGSPAQAMSKKVLRMRNHRFTMPRPSVGG